MVKHILSLKHKQRVDSVTRQCKYKKHKQLIMDSFLLFRLVKRNEEQEQLLQSKMEELIKLKKHKFARDALCLLFFPLILKTSVNMYFKYVSGYYPRCVPSDIFQEAYIIFLEMIDRYNSDRAVFPHYVNVMLKKYLYVYTMKTLSYLSKTSTRMVPNSQAMDRHCISEHKFMLNVLADIVYNDYIDLITIIKNEKSKSIKTMTKICDNIFLGSKDCSQIAKELGITYHAVYEIEKRIQKRIADMINSNKFSTYYIDIQTIQRESRKFYHTFTLRPRRFNE